MSHPPEFKSNLPESLLADINPREKYLLEQVSIIGQKSDWLLTETQKQSIDISEIKRETKATNGKVAQSIRDIADIQQKNKDKETTWHEVEKIVGFKRFFQKYLLNRYVLGVVFILLIGTYKIITNEDLRILFLKIIGLA